MYGFSPAAFVSRHEDDREVYETVEIEWLLAFLDYYRERVEEYGLVFDLTKHGLSTGTLLMSDETRDDYVKDYGRLFRIQKQTVIAKTRTLKAAWTWQPTVTARNGIMADAIGELARSMQDEISKEIMRGFRAADQRPTAAIRALTAAPRGENVALTPEGLRAQERLLRDYPLRTVQGERLRACGMLI